MINVDPILPQQPDNGGLPDDAQPPPPPIVPAVAINPTANKPAEPKPPSNRPRTVDLKSQNMKGMNIHIHNLKTVPWQKSFMVKYNVSLKINK